MDWKSFLITSVFVFFLPALLIADGSDYYDPCEWFSDVLIKESFSEDFFTKGWLVEGTHPNYSWELVQTESEESFHRAGVILVRGDEFQPSEEVLITPVIDPLGNELCSEPKIDGLELTFDYAFSQRPEDYNLKVDVCFFYEDSPERCNWLGPWRLKSDEPEGFANVWHSASVSLTSFGEKSFRIGFVFKGQQDVRVAMDNIKLRRSFGCCDWERESKDYYDDDDLDEDNPERKSMENRVLESCGLCASGPGSESIPLIVVMTAIGFFAMLRSVRKR
jgi:hypothetical protein